MGLSVYFESGITPIVTCDTCGKPIKDIRKAMVAATEIFGSETLPVYVFHRGECAPERDTHPGTQELSEYLNQLLNVYMR